jgi:uncharacterized protein (DUF1501 family)
MFPTSRRTFIRQAACAALGTSGLLNSIWDLRKVSAATISGFGDYKALVCVFLYGGNDGNNMLVPYDAASYASYAASRKDLAIPYPSLLPLTLQNSDGRSFAFHPSLLELQALFNQGKLTIVTNVGTLVGPITKAQLRAGGAAVPPSLFSHADQAVQWQTSVSGQQSPTGWGGRTADLLNSLNNSSKISLTISFAGTNMFEVGNSVFPYRLSTNGTVGLAKPPFKNALQELLRQPYHNLFQQAYADTLLRSISSNDYLGAALASAPALQTSFPKTDLAQQLQMAAKLIGARQYLSMQRQIFFCAVQGYDTHGAQLPAQANLLTELSEALNAFYSATVEMGVDTQVTTFTASDFGRTFRRDGTGSDHAWGNHQLVLGGAVRGGALYGTFPTLEIGGPDDAEGAGRWIPTTSVDEFSATMASWFGVANSDLATVFPNIGRFANPNLGFLN